MSTVSELVSKKIGKAIANVQSWGELFVNVKDFGAKGDGTTDDTEAAQNAINKAIELDKKALLFPTGVYKVTTLDYLDQVVLFGDNSRFDSLDEEIQQIGYFISPDEIVDLQNEVSGLSEGLTSEIEAREELERRVDTIINEPSEGKDIELVDIRTPATEYTPIDPIHAAGDMTRDIQKQFMSLKADFEQHEELEASETELGHVKVDGDTITINDGVISATFDDQDKVNKDGDTMTGDLNMSGSNGTTYGGQFKIVHNANLAALEIVVIP